MNTVPTPETWLSAKLACPRCGGALFDARAGLTCEGCGSVYSQRLGFPDFLDTSGLRDSEAWSDRLKQCDDWYNDLRNQPSEAARILLRDYQPFRQRLAGLTGEILDIGGGNGVPRAFLPEDVRYAVLEPSLDWLSGEWQPVAEIFPVLRTPPAFVRGVGEHLPFANASFDAVLMFWSLNHVAEPETAVAEAARVLKPGGKGIFVLEDMKPRWSDLVAGHFWSAGWKRAVKSILQMLDYLYRPRPWPLQEDHIGIEDGQMEQWCEGRFRILFRGWQGPFLTYHLQRIV